MLQIDTYTEAKLLTKTDRTEKHGDDEKPAVSLGLSLTLPNTFLDCIDPNLRPMMFKSSDTKDLPGVDGALTVLRCHSMDLFVLAVSHEGWTLYLDDGIDGTSELVFGSCKVDKLTVEPMNGGSVVLRMRAGTADVDAHKFGVLGMHLGHSVWLKLIAPKAGDADKTEAKEPKRKGGKSAARQSAEDLFAKGGDPKSPDFSPPPAHLVEDEKNPEAAAAAAEKQAAKKAKA